MLCWSCKTDIEGHLRCPGCGALQPLAPGADHFAVMGLPRRFELSLTDLEKRFRELSWQVHPDRSAQASLRERRIALERSTSLNDAYRTLKDPLRRASYLLKLHGLAIESEDRRDSAMAKLPPEFLEEVMELREGLLEAQAEDDSAAIAKLLGQVRERRAEALAEVERQLRDLPEEPEPSRLAPAGAALAQIRYYDRFVEEAEGGHAE